MSAKAITRALRRDFLSQPALVYMQFALVVIGVLFWMQARVQPEAFSAEIYGEFAVMFRAEMWAALMMAPSAMCLVGLRHPVKRWMVATGAIIHVLHFSALGYSAIVTGGELVVGYFCTVLFAPIYTWLAVEALRDA